MPMTLWWLALLTTLCIYVCYTDIRYRVVSNQSIIWMFPLCLLMLINHGHYTSIVITGCIIVIGFTLFMYNIIAAGDIKLVATLSLAIKPEYILLSICIMLFLGGGVAILYLIYGMFTNLYKVRIRGIPYAIPICLGSLLGIAASL